MQNNNNKKTVNKIDREAVFLAEEIMQDLMTACLSGGAGFTAAVEIDNDGGWYLGDTIIEGEADVQLSTTLEFEDAVAFSQTAMSVYEGILHTATKTQSLSVQDVYDTFYKAEVRTWNDDRIWMATVNNLCKNYDVELV